MANVSDSSNLINSESGALSDSENNKRGKDKDFHQHEIRDDIESKLSMMTDDSSFILDSKTNIETENESVSTIPEPKEEWDDVLSSGCLMKKILREGKENFKPHRLDICTLNYTCTLEDGTEVESVKNGTVQVGDLEVVQGFDLALPLMNIGEKSVLRIEARLAFGSQGLDNRVPPNWPVLYEIELLNAEPEPEIETLSIAQRRELGDKKKKRGNWWYGRGECTFAIQCYRRALDYLDEVEGGITEPKFSTDDPIQRAMADTCLQELMEDRINVTNNMAAAQVKQEAYDAALQSLQIVLRCQPNNVKALFRKSKVLRAKNEVQEAMKCLLKARELEPENKSIQKEILEITGILKKHKNYEKEIAKRMFSSNGDKLHVKSNKGDANAKSFVWASVALSVAVGVAGIVAWRFKYS